MGWRSYSSAQDRRGFTGFPQTALALCACRGTHVARVPRSVPAMALDKASLRTAISHLDEAFLLSLYVARRTLLKRFSNSYDNSCARIC